MVAADAATSGDRSKVVHRVASPPKHDRAATLSLYKKHVNRGLARLFELSSAPLQTHADGLYVYDGDEPYLDVGGYCVFLLGHRHPDVSAAVSQQLERMPLASRTLIEPVQAQACAAIADVAPAELRNVWIASSGTEAIEASLKIARLNGCGSFVCATGGFHGKTLGALSISGREAFRTPFEPLLEPVHRVRYGDPDAIRQALNATAKRAAVILEPIQSEAGVIVPDAGYIRAVRDACNDADALLILDEISTGLGRTGRWWCSEYEGITPDILVMGKALGGGIVGAAAVATSEEFFAPLHREPMLHSSTFAGNPLTSAAIVATVDVLREEDIPRRAAMLGDRLIVELCAIAGDRGSQIVQAVRGCGLLLGIAMTEQHFAAELMLELMNRKVLVSHSLYAQDVVRITPSALMDEAASSMLLSAFAESLTAITSRYRRELNE
jgi:putrescine aminotransferase